MVREDAEALRRRLYAPGAAGDDVDRYRRAGGGREAAARPGGRRPIPPRRAPRRIPVVLVGAVVVALVAGGIVLARQVTEPAPAAPAPTPIAVDAADGAGFEQNLAAGRVAGIAAYLITSTPLARFRGTTRLETLEDAGDGDDVVTLSPISGQAVSGKVTVLLVLEAPAQVGWTTLRRAVDASGEQRFVRQVQRAGTQSAGELTADTYRYASGDRPVQLRVDAPDGARWGVAVVFTD